MQIKRGSTLRDLVAEALRQLLAGEAHPARLVAVAPGITKIDVSRAAPPACPWLIVQGDQDEVVPPQVVLEWAQKLVPAPQVSVVPGASHFFHGRISELRETVLAFMARAEGLSASASAAADSVCWISSAEWAALTKIASNCDGARWTPCPSM